MRQHGWTLLSERNRHNTEGNVLYDSIYRNILFIEQANPQRQKTRGEGRVSDYLMGAQFSFGLIKWSGNGEWEWIHKVLNEVGSYT